MFNKRRNNRNLGRGDFAKRRPLRRSMETSRRSEFASHKKLSMEEEKASIIMGALGWSGEDPEETEYALNEVVCSYDYGDEIFGGGVANKEMAELADLLLDALRDPKVSIKQVQVMAEELCELTSDMRAGFPNERELIEIYHNNDIDKIESLIEDGFDFNKSLTSDKNDEEYGDGMTGFLTAIEEASPEVVQLLIKKGNADIDLGNAVGYSPLLVAVFRNRLDMIDMLVKAGSGVDCGYAADSPLTLAVKEGNLQMVKKLVSLGADIEEKNNDNETPLEVATNEGHTKIVSYLRKTIAEQGRGRSSRRPSRRRR